MLSVDELFKGRHFDREIIILCVRWYLRFKLSFRDLVEMMAERGVDLAHTTIMRWIQRYVPEFKSDGTASPANLGGRGGSTKPTSRSRATGPIFIAPSTVRERQSISCCARSAMSLRRKPSSRERSRPKEECLAPLRSMAIKLRTGRPGNFSANIGMASEPTFDRQNT
jgi:hypothetical protein